MKRAHLVISGNVIGVGYRAWVRRQAEAFGVVGWVKNRKDRTIELVAEGEKDQLEKLIAACTKGPDVAYVEHIETKWPPASGDFFEFSIVY